MQTVYVEDKDFRDLYLSFAIHFGERVLDVYVWKSLRGLYRNTNFRKKNYLGAYTFYPYRKKRSGLFGELHLLKRKVHAGYVSHEVAHFMIDWLTSHSLEDPNSIRALNEPFAWLTGEITRHFWNEYHKRTGAKCK